MPAQASQHCTSCSLALGGLCCSCSQSRWPCSGSLARQAQVSLQYETLLNSFNSSTRPIVESGPSVVFMTVTMMLVFGSAFFTDVIGVHAIFGSFFFDTSQSFAHHLNRSIRGWHYCPSGRRTSYQYHGEARGYGLDHLPATGELYFTFIH